MITSPSPERSEGPTTMPVDEDGWWSVERAAWIRERVVALTQPGDVVVDVGCGRGAMFAAEPLRDRTVVCVDSHRWDSWRPGPEIDYVIAAADQLPFADGTVDLVGSFDVLEHLVDDERGLREQQRIVRSDGHVVTAVPADPRLWSVHDEAVGHHRRYRVPTFARLADVVGLDVQRATHFYSFLWVPAWLTRRRRVRGTQPAAGDRVLARVVRRVVGLACAAERSVLRRADVPIGTSLWFESRRRPDGAAGTDPLGG